MFLWCTESPSSPTLQPGGILRLLVMEDPEVLEITKRLPAMSHENRLGCIGLLASDFVKASLRNRGRK